MVSAKEVILEYVSPFLGVVIGNMMFSAAFRDVRRAVTLGSLGDLNPTPWAFMLGNCAGWVAYSYIIQNYWVFFGNAPGFLLSIWLNLSAAKLQYSAHRESHLRASVMEALVPEGTVAVKEGDSDVEKQTLSECSAELDGTENDPPQKPLAESTGQIQPCSAETPEKISMETTENTTASSTTNVIQVAWDVAAQKIQAPAPHERITVGIATVWVVLISIVAFASFSRTVEEYIIGISVNLNLLFFYGAPLSTIFLVLSTQDSSSIHVRTMLTNTANGTFWGAYGLAVADPFIYVPNGLGAGLGVAQIVLCFIFPRKSARAVSTETITNESSLMEEAEPPNKLQADKNKSTRLDGGSIEEPFRRSQVTFRR